MGYFDVQTERVELPEDNWAVIQRLNYGMRQEAMGEASQIEMTTSSWTVNPSLLRVEELIRAVKEWGGPDLDGVPVSRESILTLPDEVGFLLQRKLQDLQQRSGVGSEVGNESGEPTSNT